MPLTDLVLSVLAAPTPGIPLLIGGCSAGRTHALHAVMTQLGTETTPVYLDVERLATTPEQCYRSLLRHVRASRPITSFLADRRASLADYGDKPYRSVILGFPLNGGAIGIWIGLVAGLIVAAALLTWRFHWLSRGCFL